MTVLEQFANDKYKLLLFLSKKQIDIAGNCYISLSQQEIADGIGFSKLKTNNLIKDLKDLGCLTSYMGKNGKYQITEQGYHVLNTINSDGHEGEELP